MVPWRTPGDDDATSYLQSRLVVLSKAMFWSFCVLLVFMAVAYTSYSDLKLPDRVGLAPRDNNTIFVISAGGVVILAALWRMLLVRRDLSLAMLERIDAFFCIGTGGCFGVAGWLTSDFRPSAYICLIYSCLTVLLRASVVPSTRKRTAVISVASLVPIMLATVLISPMQENIPSTVYVGGGYLLCVMVVLLAMLGSQVLYGLHRQVAAAMKLGQYTLERQIGEGGNGFVYRARHALLRRPTAVKLIRPDRVDAETLDRFEREVQLMSTLTHANTVAIYDYGRSPDGVFYYAMEYLDGIDLEKLVQRYGAQPADRVVPILIQVCSALNEAHRRGLIHRDIKPGNIILCNRGDVPDVAKVVDFGMVKELGHVDGQSTRGVMGTPSYIAPESVTAPEQVTHAVDLYALGAVGFFLVTGKLLFEGKTSVDVCVQHVTADPRPASSVAAQPVPPELDAILLRCLAKRPEERPVTAAELAELLRAVPIGTAWTNEVAVAWWRDFARSEAAIPETQPSRTITIDMDQRVGGPAGPAPFN